VNPNLFRLANSFGKSVLIGPQIAGWRAEVRIERLTQHLRPARLAVFSVRGGPPAMTSHGRPRKPWPKPVRLRRPTAPCGGWASRPVLR
jgi:hypothetical protein